MSTTTLNFRITSHRETVALHQSCAIASMNDSTKDLHFLSACGGIKKHCAFIRTLLNFRMMSLHHAVPLHPCWAGIKRHFAFIRILLNVASSLSRVALKMRICIDEEWRSNSPQHLQFKSTCYGIQKSFAFIRTQLNFRVMAHHQSVALHLG